METIVKTDVFKSAQIFAGIFTVDTKINTVGSHDLCTQTQSVLRAD